MKTVIKITAIAVITILAALACSEDIGLTPRDYSERNESKSAEYTSSPAEDISFTSNLKYDVLGVPETNKEITITFPENADILRETNANIGAKLKEFLSFHTYTNPASPPDPDVYTPSTLGSALDYTFERRNNNNITVKLTSVPNIECIEARVDASKYKVFGQLVDFNRDGIGGESYDDSYETIYITYGAPMTPGSYTSDFTRPETTYDIILRLGTGGDFTTIDVKKVITLFSTGGFGADNAQRRKIISDIKDKIEFQKYNQTTNAWVKEGNVTLFEYNGTVPAGLPSGFTTDLLYVDFTMEDLGIYRLKATGIANLTSADNVGAKPAKITITFVGGTPSPASYRYGTGYSAPISYYNASVRQWETENPVASVVVNSDADRRNVVLNVYFNKVVDNVLTEPKDVWLKPLDIKAFNNSVKLVYLKNGSAIPSDTDLSTYKTGEIVELKIDSVTYSASKQFDDTNINNNCITITLDPAYKINGGRSISLLLSPGFSYTGDQVTFGDNGNGDNSVGSTYYNGTFFWRSYGELVSGLRL